MSKVTHGGTYTRLYRVWVDINRRCHNPAYKDFPRYGGRGIKVCEEWRNSFAAFQRDMGERPTPNHSIDRINNDEGYNPENCRWADRSQQAKNRRERPRSSTGKYLPASTPKPAKRGTTMRKGERV